MEKGKETISLDGTHLMADLKGCDKKILGNSEKVREFLDTLPNMLGMKKMIKPYVVVYKGGDSWDKGGITGFMLIAESHISIHTFQHDGFLTADVYSCKPFDFKGAVAYMKEFFGSKEEKVQVAKRGLEIIRENGLREQTAKAIIVRK